MSSFPERDDLLKLLEQVEAKIIGSDDAVEIIRDIRSRVEVLSKRLEEHELRAIYSDKLTSLAEMSTGVAHELNQPLNTILMAAQLVLMWLKKEKEIDTERLERMMSDIERSVRRASKVITHMREFGANVPASIMPIDLNKPIFEVFDLLREQHKKQDIEVIFNLTDGLPQIRADNRQLQQIFFQFVSNARDAMFERERTADDPEYSKKLIVTTGVDENNMVFASFEDNGAGIPEQNLQKIFEPFFTTKEVGKGEGLGLSIIYGLVQNCKGRIEARSELGVGAMFILNFPPA